MDQTFPRMVNPGDVIVFHNKQLAPKKITILMPCGSRISVTLSINESVEFVAGKLSGGVDISSEDLEYSSD